MQGSELWAHLRRIRLLLGIPQGHMADSLQVPRTTFTDWETGRRTPRDASVAGRYAEALGLTLEGDE